jgi:hypothetical protein
MATLDAETDVFPDIFSPKHPYEYPVLDSYNPATHDMFSGVENAEEDSMTEFLNAVLRNQEECSSNDLGNEIAVPQVRCCLVN